MATYQIRRAPVAVAAAGDNMLALPGVVTGKKVRVIKLMLVNKVATAQAVTVKSGAAGGATALTGAMDFQSVLGSQIDFGDPAGWENAYLLTKNGEDLNISLAAATAVAGFIVYMVTD